MNILKITLGMLLAGSLLIGCGDKKSGSTTPSASAPAATQNKPSAPVSTAQAKPTTPQAPTTTGGAATNPGGAGAAEKTGTDKAVTGTNPATSAPQGGTNAGAGSATTGAGASTKMSTVMFPAAKVKVAIPENWKNNVTSDMIEAYDKEGDDSEVYVSFAILKDATDVEAAAKELDKYISDNILDAKMSKDFKVEKVNGMDSIYWEIEGKAAKGKNKGKEVAASYGFVETPSGKLLEVYAEVLTSSKNLKDFVTQLNAVEKGIQPLD